VRRRTRPSLDPKSFAMAAVLVPAVVALASAIPGWRAARVDPTTALRDE
jgi:ABC-type lipoprotein release transport system permease subunit